MNEGGISPGFYEVEKLEAELGYTVLHKVVQGSNICHNQGLMQIQWAL